VLRCRHAGLGMRSKDGSWERPKLFGQCRNGHESKTRSFRSSQFSILIQALHRGVDVSPSIGAADSAVAMGIFTLL
jgi:hypothetical protein